MSQEPVESAASDMTVIIPVRDDAERLALCLTSLRAQSGGPEVRVIVADNGSTDGSPEVARAAQADVVDLPGLSVARMRNHAVLQADTRLIAFVDADHILGPGWLPACLLVMGDPTIGAAGAPYEPPSSATWVQRAYDRFRTRFGGHADVEWLGSGNLAIRRELFARLGGFDETLETCEDVDLCNRLRAAGARLVVEPGMRSVHLGDPATLRALFFGELWRGRDNLRVSLRGPLTLRALPSVITPLLVLSVLMLTVASLLITTVDARGWIGVASGLAVVIAVVGLRTLRMSRCAWHARALAENVAVAAVYEMARAFALVARASHGTRRSGGARR